MSIPVTWAPRPSSLRGSQVTQAAQSSPAHWTLLAHVLLIPIGGVAALVLLVYRDRPARRMAGRQLVVTPG